MVGGGLHLVVRISTRRRRCRVQIHCVCSAVNEAPWVCPSHESLSTPSTSVRGWWWEMKRASARLWLSSSLSSTATTSPHLFLISISSQSILPQSHARNAVLCVHKILLSETTRFAHSRPKLPSKLIRSWTASLSQNSYRSSFLVLIRTEDSRRNIGRGQRPASMALEA